MENRRAIEPVVLGTRLMAVDLDRQRVDVERHVALPMAAISRFETSRGTFKQEVAQDGPIVRGGKRFVQARQRGLRSESAGCGIGPVIKRRHAAVVRDRDSQRGIPAEEVGVILVTPAERRQNDRRAQQLGSRVADGAATGILELGRQVARQSEPFICLAQQQGTSFGSQALRATFDVNGAIERWPDWCDSFTLNASPDFWCTGSGNPRLPSLRQTRYTFLLRPL
jgi:hypothetical protein